jgi:hypothetical protein
MDGTVMPLIIYREKPEPDKLIVLGQAAQPIVKEQAIPEETQEVTEEAPKPKRGRPPKNKETE